MIIKDVNGGKLRLTKNRLTELTKGRDELYRFYALLKDIEESTARLTNTELHYHHPTVHVSLVCREIGCRKFNKTTFSKIMRAVKAAKKKAKK